MQKFCVSEEKKFDRIDSRCKTLIMTSHRPLDYPDISGLPETCNWSGYLSSIRMTKCTVTLLKRRRRRRGAYRRCAWSSSRSIISFNFMQECFALRPCKYNLDIKAFNHMKANQPPWNKKKIDDKNYFRNINIFGKILKYFLVPTILNWRIPESIKPNNLEKVSYHKLVE